MKYSIIFLMIFLCIVSCDDLEITNPNHPDFPAELNIDKTTQIVDHTSGSFIIKITSNVSWTVSSSDSWLTFSPDCGNENATVNINYEDNNDTINRIGTITIYGFSIKQTCIVKQSEFVPNLTINPLIKVISSISGSFNINVTSNVNWSVSSSDSWLTYIPTNSYNNGNVTVNYTSNYQESERKGEITIVGNGIVQSCSIDQEAAFMILIPGGTFLMGCDDWNSNEMPVHTVTVSDFYMSKYEVTQKLYDEVIGTNPSNWNSDELPVENVNWYDAVEFCNALSQREGLIPAYTISGTSVTWNQNANGYRLPTEAEWEYAARAGTTTLYSIGEMDGKEGPFLRDYAWYQPNSGGTTHNVGEKLPNPLGLYDTYGNVAELVQDSWGDTYSAAKEDGSAVVKSGSTLVVARGGSYSSKDNALESAYRTKKDARDGDANTGFRLVMDA